jgi:hypothetical protein
MANSDPRRKSIPINAKGGAWTPIPLTITASKVEVMEDPAYNNGAFQGLTGYFVDTQPPQPAGVNAPAPAGPTPPAAIPNYQFTWLPNDQGQEGAAYQPIKFGGGEGGRVHGAFAEYPGAQGTVILWLTTNSQNAGGVLLEEWA